MAQDFSRINSKEMNKLNKSKVLKLIFEGKVLSTGDIIKQTGLTAPSVSRLVKSLISEEGLVKHSGIGHSNGGRPPFFYDFNGTGRYIIGIDVGATYIRAVLSNLDAEILYELEVLTEREKGYESVIQKLTDIIGRLSGRKEIGRAHV